jgi:hypothetical protein
VRVPRAGSGLAQQAPQELSVDAAEAVRRACMDAAERAYEDAGIRGLCPAGRWEAALGAMRALNLGIVIAASHGNETELQPQHRAS